MYKQLMLSVATALTLLQPSYSLATSQQQGVNQTVPKEVWLGLRSANIPNILRSQLSGVIPNGQGIMITDVIVGSPAAKGGLHINDVILRADDQKIYSPRQLTALVKASTANSSIKFSVVRAGKVRNLSVLLGQRDRPQFSNWPSFGSGFGQNWLNPSMPNFPSPNNNKKGQSSSSWDSFESIQVKTLANGRYHAEVKYKDPRGNDKGFSFEGKREEIIAQITNEKELPETKKQALLKALNMDSGQLFNHPFFQGRNPFDDPFFKQDSLFNDPFFQQGFPNFQHPNRQRFFKQDSPVWTPNKRDDFF